MAAAVKYYKALNTDRSCFHGGMGTWEPEGVPMPRIEGTLVACQNGYHVSTLEHLHTWIGPAIWDVAVDTDGMVDAGDKIVVRQATLTRRAAWNINRMVSFALDCAEHVEHMATKEAVELNAMTRRYVAGTATKEELDAASDAASDASYASDAARYASYAARYASYASYAASYAARYASYASDAASDAASGARYAAEKAWQVQRLRHYLEGPV